MLLWAQSTLFPTPAIGAAIYTVMSLLLFTCLIKASSGMSACAVLRPLIAYTLKNVKQTKSRHRVIIHKYYVKYCEELTQLCELHDF